jgi:K+-transporting ATPase KdpF subunit
MTAWQREFHDAGPDIYHFNGGLFGLLSALGKIPGKGVAMMQIVTGIVALSLIAYLFVSIFRPEKF